MSSVAERVAARKRAFPERFCPAPLCLWATRDGSYCPRHESVRVSSVASPASDAGETRRTPPPPLPDDLVAELRDEARQEWADDDKATDDDMRMREAYDPPDRRGT